MPRTGDDYCGRTGTTHPRRTVFGLDPYGVRLVREVVAAERDRGATVFFSSHVLDQVERVCDRVGLLSDGRLIAEGTPKELRDMAGVRTQLHIDTESDNPSIQAISELADVEDVPSETGRIIVTCPRTVRYNVLETLDDGGVNIQSFNIEQGTIEDAFVELATD